MLEYHGLLYRKYKLPVIQQVFYIGSGSSKMKNKIEHPNISFKYGLMSFQEISYLEFIDSEIPEEIMLAILANFEGEKAEIIITEILTKIERLQIGTLLKKKTVRQLSILSRLRNLQPIVDNLINKIMALNLDIKDDTYYIKGKKEKQDRMILALLKKGKLSPEEIAEVAEVSLAYVNNLAKTIE